MKRRIIVLVLALAIMLSMTACGGILGDMISGGNKKGSTDKIVSGLFDDLEDMVDDMNQVPVIDLPVAEVAPQPEAAPETEPAAPQPETEPAAEWNPTEPNSSALEDIIFGTWLRETMYLSHYGCDADLYITFNRDGSAYQLVLNHDTSEVLSETTGKWWLEDDDVLMKKDSDNGTVRYEYFESTQRLKNGDKYYEKIF